MPNYAIIQDNTVVNVIVAESKEIAEAVTGLSATETNGEPWMAWELVDGVWVDPYKLIEAIQFIPVDEVAEEPEESEESEAPTE